MGVEWTRRHGDPLPIKHRQVKVKLYAGLSPRMKTGIRVYPDFTELHLLGFYVGFSK